MLVQGLHYLASDTQLMQTGAPDSAIVTTLLSHIMLTTLTALLLPWLFFLQSERKLTLKSQRDGMTNLSNRSHFLALVEQYWTRHPHKPLVIMMIDIDHFKIVNDQFGHMVGDKVIKGVADILNKGLRSHDILGRVGGEEFAVLIANEKTNVAREIGLRLLTLIENGMLKMDELEINLTISIGLEEVVPEKHQILSSFSAADKALYDSKHNGRNRLSIGDVEHETMGSPAAKSIV